MDFWHNIKKKDVNNAVLIKCPLLHTYSISPSLTRSRYRPLHLVSILKTFRLLINTDYMTHLRTLHIMRIHWNVIGSLWTTEVGLLVSVVLSHLLLTLSKFNKTRFTEVIKKTTTHSISISNFPQTKQNMLNP